MRPITFPIRSEDERKVLVQALEAFLRSLEAKRRQREPKVLEPGERLDRAAAEDLAQRIAVAR